MLFFGNNMNFSKGEYWSGAGVEVIVGFCNIVISISLVFQQLENKSEKHYKYLVTKKVNYTALKNLPVFHKPCIFHKYNSNT